tara:strand:+ start:1317 stop:2579 length:1263 start_codon:yes stop_codon:yes gene_type:complete
MLSRAEFDRFLQLYGIPTSDARYEQYKKTQSSSLANKQFNELASQVKQKVDKPTMPDIIVGPGTEATNKAARDKYNKQLSQFNNQEKIIQTLLKASADRVKYFDEKEKIANSKQPKTNRTNTAIPYESPQDLKDLKGKLNTLPKTFTTSTPDQDKAYHDRLDDEYVKYQMNHHPIYDKPVKRIPKTNPIPNTNKHINHNIMSFQQYKNFRFNGGFEVGQKEYLSYLGSYNLNKPTDHLQGQIQVAHNAAGHSSLAKGQSIEDHQKQHSKNIIQHLKGNVAVPGQIEKKTPPPAIVLHNFSTPTPAANQHTVSAHSLNKQAGTMVGNPIYANSKPKVVSGPREDNHLNPTRQPNPVGASITSGVQAGPAFKNVAVKPRQPVPQAPAGQIQGETFAQFRARTRPNTTPAPQPVGQDAGDMII